MKLSLLMITLITKKGWIDVFEGQQILSKHFSSTNFRQRRAKSVHGNMALPCILNKTAVAFSTEQ